MRVTSAEFSKCFPFQNETNEQRKRTKADEEAFDLVPENMSSTFDMVPSTSLSIRYAIENPQKALNATHIKKHRQRISDGESEGGADCEGKN